MFFRFISASYQFIGYFPLESYAPVADKEDAMLDDMNLVGKNDI